MADRNRERDEAEEIDVLVRELMTRRFEPPKAGPGGGQPAGSPQAARPPGSQPFASGAVEPRTVSRWSNVRMLMPSMPAAASASRPAFASAISLPDLPDLRGAFSLPGPVTLARMWVGLGAVYGAAMTYWPYPKTYWLGLVLYLLSLGLVLVTGIWGARLSWEARLGTAHTIALGTVGWAIALAAAVTLPLLP